MQYKYKKKHVIKSLKHVHRRVTRHIGPALHIARGPKGPRANMELLGRYAW